MDASNAKQVVCQSHPALARKPQHTADKGQDHTVPAHDTGYVFGEKLC